MKRRSWNCTMAPLGCHRMSPGPTSSWIEKRSSCLPRTRWSRRRASSSRRRYAEVVFSEPGRAVDALEHLAPLVAPPIGARAVQQLEMLDAPRARHMRSATQVHERAVGVHRDHLVRAEVVDPLELERVVLEAL